MDLLGNFRPEDLAKVKNLEKQILFALAASLTAAAQAGQAAAIAAIQQTFTVRTSWFEKGNRFGIKVQPAKRDNLVATISTRAWWLADHESGQNRDPRRNFIAVPTDAVKRSKRDLITASTRRKLLDPGNQNVFRLETRKGLVLATRTKQGKGSKLQVLFGLEPEVHIKKQSTFFDPIQKTVQQTFPEIFPQKLKQAISTAKS